MFRFQNQNGNNNGGTRNEAPPPPPVSSLKPTSVTEGFSRGQGDTKSK